MKKLTFILLMGGVMLILASCQREFSAGSIRQLKTNVKVSQAKELFEQVTVNKGLFKSSNPYTNMPVWEEYYSDTSSLGGSEILNVRLFSQQRFGFRRLLFANVNDTLKGVVMVVAATPEYFAKKVGVIENGDFTGKLHFFSLDGKYLRGYRYEKGLVVATLIPNQSRLKAYEAEQEDPYCADCAMSGTIDEFVCMPSGGGSIPEEIFTVPLPSLPAVRVDVPTSENFIFTVGGISGGTGSPTNPTFKQQYTDPCERLKQITSSTSIASLNDSLLAFAKTLNYEVAFTVTASGNVNKYTGPVGLCVVPMGLTEPVQTIIHSHHGECEPIFSPGDVALMWEVISKSKGNAYAFNYGLCTSDGTVYYLSVVDIVKFTDYCIAHNLSTLEGCNAYIEFYKDSYNGYYDGRWKSDIVKLENGFLRYITNSGLSLTKDAVQNGLSLKPINASENGSVYTVNCTSTINKLAE